MHTSFIVRVQVSTPCIPCQHPCDKFVCNVTCAAADNQVIRVQVSDLTLTPRQTDNNTQLQPYYMTVKGVTGSGRAVTASSRAIYVDVTPPVIQLMYHVDLGWSQAEPTSFQGGNSSIALYFEVLDPESGVKQAILNDICLQCLLSPCSLTRSAWRVGLRPPFRFP